MSAVLFDTKFEKGSGAYSPFSFVSNAGTVAGSVGANSNRVLIGMVGFRTTVALVATVSMTWNGVAMTPIGAGVDSPVGTLVCVFLFGLINPATGAQTISVSWTGPGNVDVALGADSLYNADQTTGWQNATSAAATSTAPSVTVTTSTDNMAVAGIADNNSSSFTITSPSVQDWSEHALNGNYEQAHCLATGASTVIAGTLGNSQGWCISAVEVIQVAAGGGTTYRPLFMAMGVGR